MREGEAVVTSGASGEFPRGIKVGKATGAGDNARVVTLLAGCITLLIDLAWRDRSSDRPLNVTARGAGDRPAHV